MPLAFREDRWVGNRWAAIEIEPADPRFFPRVLLHLARTYGLATPDVVDTIDGWACDFAVLGSPAKMMVDAWSFSIAFAEDAVRDRVLADLRRLRPDAFDLDGEA